MLSPENFFNTISCFRFCTWIKENHFLLNNVKWNTISSNIKTRYRISIKIYKNDWSFIMKFQNFDHLNYLFYYTSTLIFILFKTFSSGTFRCWIYMRKQWWVEKFNKKSRKYWPRFKWYIESRNNSGSFSSSLSSSVPPKSIKKSYLITFSY